MHPLSAITYLCGSLADIVFPPRCYVCLRENTWLCRACSRQFPIHRPGCAVCQKPHPRGLTCLQCRLKTPLHGLISAGSYREKDLARATAWLKFKGVREIAPILARRITPYVVSIAALEQLRDQALLIPIPLHRHRERQRGFNQSRDIAAGLSSHTGIPMADLLTRPKATLTQRELPADMRRQNMSQAFVKTADLPARRWYLIVDDITTTGSTLSAAAAALGARPSSEIWGVTLAHG